MKNPTKLTELISVYFTAKEKEAILDYMMKNTYHVSFSAFLREVILKELKIKL